LLNTDRAFTPGFTAGHIIIILPITSGDTALRSARMMIADYFKICQKKLSNRLWVARLLSVVSFMLTAVDFNLLWRYFSWANQSMAMITLWIAAVYLYSHNRNYWIALIPPVLLPQQHLPVF